MVSPKISIIVPVYNAERYLNRCIDSILAQSFTNFELLLINDGSLDRSGEICDLYAQRDSRIRVYHKRNAGVSSARNWGLSNATGEWVIFLDSDDWIEKECIDSCMTVISQFPDLDIIRFAYYKETNGYVETYTCEKSRMIVSPKEMLYFCDKYSFWGYVWNTVYKKKLIGELRFNQNLNWLEDHIFTYKYIGQCNSMYLLNKPMYHYELLNSGLSSKMDAGNVKSAAEEEFMAISAILGVEGAISGYYGKLKMAISLLYKYEKEYCKRREFYNSFTLLSQTIDYKDFIINLYTNRHIPFFIKDFILRARIKDV